MNLYLILLDTFGNLRHSFPTLYILIVPNFHSGTFRCSNNTSRFLSPNLNSKNPFILYTFSQKVNLLKRSKILLSLIKDATVKNGMEKIECVLEI